MIKIKNFVKLAIATTALAAPVIVSAATLSFDPESKLSSPGDVILVPLRIYVDRDECVNAATVSIVYPADKISVQTIGRGESIFPLWLNEKIDNTAGESHFSVGIPGGFCGEVAGDTGHVNIVAKVAFQYKSNVPTVVGFGSSTEVALADGAGTIAVLLTKPLTVSLASGETVRNEWLGEVAGDHFPPEQFTPEIMKDSTSERSPFYLIFSTTDKQSGVDHYTVREEDPRSFGFHIGSSVHSKDIPAVSPYVLQDQTLRSRIVVRVHDKAGNVTEAILPPTNERPVFGGDNLGTYLILGAGVGVLISVLLWSMRRYVWRDDVNEV